MKLLNVTLDTPEHNLALDEALLLRMEDSPRTEVETLRVWEPQTTHVVLGRASKAAIEARLEECVQAGVPVFRRTTGGATILAGTGCLFYSVVLSQTQHPDLKGLETIHEFVLGRIADALDKLHSGVRREGTSDLAIACEDGSIRKFSGNSLRVRRKAILYHGTLLFNFPLADIPKYLGSPSRQPDYRGGRDHVDFVTNLPLTSSDIKLALIQTWQASTTTDDWPESAVQELVDSKYNCNDWNLRL